MISSLNTQLTVTGLTIGETYHFRSKAQNIHGFGDLSPELTVISSGVPAMPTSAVVTIVNQNVQISWSAPVDNYGAITSYMTSIAEHG